MVQVKGNQQALLEACEDIVLFSSEQNSFVSEEKSRNRVEKRTTKVFYDQKEFIEDTHWSKYIKTVVSVERVVDSFNTKTKNYQRSKEEAIYVANFVLTAKQAAKVVRNHWAIENKNHYVRDVTLKEDESRIRINPENMAKIRSFALNVMRANKVNNINGELYENSLDYYDLYNYQHFI